MNPSLAAWLMCQRKIKVLRSNNRQEAPREACFTWQMGLAGRTTSARSSSKGYFCMALGFVTHPPRFDFLRRGNAKGRQLPVSFWTWRILVGGRCFVIAWTYWIVLSEAITIKKTPHCPQHQWVWLAEFNINERLCFIRPRYLRNDCVWTNHLQRTPNFGMHSAYHFSQIAHIRDVRIGLFSFSLAVSRG